MPSASTTTNVQIAIVVAFQYRRPSILVRGLRRGIGIGVLCGVIGGTRGPRSGPLRRVLAALM